MLFEVERGGARPRCRAHSRRYLGEDAVDVRLVVRMLDAACRLRELLAYGVKWLAQLPGGRQRSWGISPIAVCEERHLVPSHGMLFASHACQIVFKGGEIEQFWLYSD